MYVVFQENIQGAQSTAAANLAIAVLDEYEPGEIGRHLRSLGFTGAVPTEYAPLTETIVKHDAAGAEVLRYDAGVAEVAVVTVGDDINGVFVKSVASLEEGTWVLTRTYHEPPAAIYRKRLSRPEFKLQFTSAERIVIRAARDYTGEDGGALALKAALNDFFDIVEDPALTFVDLELPATIEGIGFLAAVGLITEPRAAEILSGLPA